MQFREEANAINIHVKCECEILLNSDSKKKVNLRSNEENDNLQNVATAHFLHIALFFFTVLVQCCVRALPRI